jgi:hypothetical protein
MLNYADAISAISHLNNTQVGNCTLQVHDDDVPPYSLPGLLQDCQASAIVYGLNALY